MTRGGCLEGDGPDLLGRADANPGNYPCSPPSRENSSPPGQRPQQHRSDRGVNMLSLRRSGGLIEDGSPPTGHGDWTRTGDESSVPTPQRGTYRVRTSFPLGTSTIA